MFDLFKKGLSSNLSDYSNIKFDFPIGYFLTIIFAALLITMLVANYRRYVLCLVSAKLLRHVATSEENAKNLASIGISKGMISLVLSSGGQFEKIFGVKGKREYTYEEYTELIKKKSYKEEKTDYKTAELYIKEDSVLLAKHLSESTSPGVLTNVLLCVLVIVCYFILTVFLPDILTLINNMIA